MSSAGDRTLHRLAWLDYAKGLGIALVVLGHANRSIGRTPELVWSDGLNALDAAIYSFHMPLFFVLAGFASGLAKPKDAAAFANNMLWSVALPYFLWSVVWIGLKAALPGVANTPIGLEAIPKLLWQPVEHFWFLYHLFFARLIWHVVQRAGGLHGEALMLLATTAAALLATPLTGEHGALLGFLENLAYFGAGLVLMPLLIASGPLAGFGAAAAFGLAWLVVLAFTGGAPVAPAMLAALAGAGAVIGFARALPEAETPFLKALALLGEASLAIYVLHLIFAAGMRVGLAKAGLLSPDSLLILGTLAGLAGPILFYIGVQRLNGRSGLPLSRWTGLGQPRRAPLRGFIS